VCACVISLGFPAVSACGRHSGRKGTHYFHISKQFVRKLADCAVEWKHGCILAAVWILRKLNQKNGLYKGFGGKYLATRPKYAILERFFYHAGFVAFACFTSLGGIWRQGKSGTFARQLWDFCTPDVALLHAKSAASGVLT